MKYKAFKIGEEVSIAQVHDGIEVQAFQSGMSEEPQQIDITEKEFKDIDKLKTATGKKNKLNAIIKDRNI